MQLGTKPRTSNWCCNLFHFVQWMGINTLRYRSIPFLIIEGYGNHWKFQLNDKVCLYDITLVIIHIFLFTYVSFAYLLEKLSIGPHLYYVTICSMKIFCESSTFCVIREKSPWQTTFLEAINNYFLTEICFSGSLSWWVLSLDAGLPLSTFNGKWALNMWLVQIDMCGNVNYIMKIKDLYKN